MLSIGVSESITTGNNTTNNYYNNSTNQVHNNLTGLQGGSTNELYHMTALQNATFGYNASYALNTTMNTNDNLKVNKSGDNLTGALIASKQYTTGGKGTFVSKDYYFNSYMEMAFENFTDGGDVNIFGNYTGGILNAVKPGVGGIPIWIPRNGGSVLFGSYSNPSNVYISSLGNNSSIGVGSNGLLVRYNDTAHVNKTGDTMTGSLNLWPSVGDNPLMFTQRTAGAASYFSWFTYASVRRGYFGFASGSSNPSITIAVEETNGHIILSPGSGGSLQISTLSGSGNAYACLDSTGKLYRSATICV
jgi:hypothetical protein